MAKQMTSKGGAEKTFQTSVDLSPDQRKEIIGMLNQQLADTFDLYAQTKQAHWNVKGPNFIQLHELYDTLAEGVFEYIDQIAERATALGGAAMGTTRMAADATRLPEFPPGGVEDMESVRCLVERYANVANSTREAIDLADEHGDAGTADLFTQFSRDMDKWLWFLEAHLQQA